MFQQANSLPNMGVSVDCTGYFGGQVFMIL